MIIALIIVALAGLSATVNALVFIGTRESVQRMSPNEYRPFHWTVLVGPFAYYPWLSRQEKAAKASPILMEVLDNREDRNVLRQWNADGHEICPRCRKPLYLQVERIH